MMRKLHNGRAVREFSLLLAVMLSAALLLTVMLSAALLLTGQAHAGFGPTAARGTDKLRESGDHVATRTYLSAIPDTRPRT